MSSADAVYVVFLDGDKGGYPYGVFSSEEAARDARVAIIQHLDSKSREHLSKEMREVAHQLTGTLDETITIEECELRSEFNEAELENLFEDVDSPD